LASQPQEITFNMMGINGIDLIPWPMRNTSFTLAISFVQSQIDFFINETEISDDECSADMMSKYGDKTTFFNLFADITFEQQNTYPKKPICAYLFSSAELNSLSIYSLIDSIVVNNMWIFKPLDTNTTETAINSTIHTLNLGGYGYGLDTGLMHQFVFEAVQYLFIYRSVGSVQVDLFKHFHQIKHIRLELDSLMNFVHKIGFAWTTSLPVTNQSWIVLSTYDESSANWIDGSEYSYPDEDFCLFAQYPQRNSLIYILDNLANLTECTSTIRFILSNYFTQNISQVLHSFPATHVIFSICKNSNGTVDFEPMISNCNMSHLTGSDTINAEFYQVEYIFEFVQDIFIFIAIPCACALGLFLNILIIRAVHQNQQKDLKDNFYQYMSLNSKFNCLNCIVFLFYPVNSCVDIMTGYFCSSIRASYVTQLYKIVLVSFFGEAFKMCSNIMFILMNVNRYMLIGREHSATFEKISKWNMNWVIAVTVFTSLLASVAHAFQYELRNSDFYRYFDSISYMYLYPSYPAIVFTSTTLYYYLLVYFIFNFLVFFVVNTSVEVILVRKLHKELADKKKRLEKLETANTRAISLTESMSFRKKRKLDIEDRAEQRAISMVVINALLNFFLRLPELFVLFTLSYKIFNYSFLNSFIETFANIRTFTTDITYFFLHYYVYYQFSGLLFIQSKIQTDVF
jgi:hypothetical protein